MSNSLNITINDKTARRLIEGFPKFVNQAMNRGYQAVTTEFGRTFVKQRLRKGILKVSTGRKARPQGKGQVKLPSKMRLLGFKAVIGRRDSIDDKSLSIRTNNPIVRIKERGGPIRPVKGKFLFLRGDFKGRGAKARRAAFQAKGGRFKKPITAKKRQIIVKAVLGFRRLWQSMKPKTIARLDKSLVDASKRAEKSIRGK